MKTSLRVAVIILILSCISMAQEKSNTHDKKTEFEPTQLEDYERHTPPPPQQKAEKQNIQPEPGTTESDLLSEINDSLLAIIKMVESREPEIKKLIQHEQGASQKEIMIKRLRLIRNMIKDLTQNAKGGSQ